MTIAEHSSDHTQRLDTIGHAQQVTAASLDWGQAVDALYRFAAGQDLRDPALLASAFSADASLDFTQPAARFGAALPVFESRDTIVSTIGHSLARLRTTHTVTNPRLEIEGDHARLFALVEAQHVSQEAPADMFLLKNIYRLRLVRDGQAWLIEHMHIETVWHEGNPRLLFA